MDLVERQAVKSYWDGGGGGGAGRRDTIPLFFYFLWIFLIGVFFSKGAKQKIASMCMCKFL